MHTTPAMPAVPSQQFPNPHYEITTVLMSKHMLLLTIFCSRAVFPRSQLTEVAGHAPLSPLLQGFTDTR
jgi:hypothetical protein